MTQVVATLIPQPPLSLSGSPNEPQSSIGAFFEPARSCDLFHSIETFFIDNGNRDGDTPHPPNTLSRRLGHPEPRHANVGAFFSIFGSVSQ